MYDCGLLDSGSVTFLRVSSTEGSAASGRWNLSELVTLPYQARVTGYAHHYAAKAANQSVDKTIRIDCYPEITLSIPDTLAQIDGRYHRILKITPTTNADALPVLDIDLTDDDTAIRRKIAT